MATWRVHVTGTTAEATEAFKNRFFKKLYNSGGLDLVFELPENNEAGADEIAAEAGKLQFKAKKEKFVDPLESVDATADFW